MKLALFLFIAVLITAAAPAASGQTRKTARTKSKTVKTVKSLKNVKPAVTVYAEEPPPLPPAPPVSVRETAISDVFVNTEIGKWGIAGLSVPRDLKREEDSETARQNGDVSWTDYLQSWKASAVPFADSPLEIDVSVTTWNSKDFSFVQDLREDLKTPENLLLVDLIMDIKIINNPVLSLKEASLLEIGGVKGEFIRLEYPANDHRFMIGWHTYRCFEGKAQKVSLTITGRKTELQKAKKIMQSLKLQ